MAFFFIVGLVTISVPLAQVEGRLPANSANGPLCNTAQVQGIRPGKFLPVRSGHAAHDKIIDRLTNGAIVYTCDNWGDWLNIFYGRPETPCGRNLMDGLEESKARRCKSGWVKQNWIDIISG